jgi:hypothetical protein
MPAKQLKTSKRTVTLDARPDRTDLRDRIYQPPLVSLPPAYPPDKWLKTYLPKYRKAGLILDQGKEGACTGFGLAAVINYLLFRQSVKAKAAPPARVSTRMLYHLARRYDEWPGEDYEGSSCRGAMKGWFHHGICADELWPYRDKTGKAVFVPPGKDWDRDAAQRPLGAYYRVTVDSIADLQAAINEVGAVYVSSDVHRGWDRVGEKSPKPPTIEWKPGTKPDGGHAFALVGYNAHGFIVQNSWGPDWGFQGFAVLTYEDWLQNADDAWVAVMGAPIAARSPAVMLSSKWTVPKSAQDLANGLANGATAEMVSARPRPNAWDTVTAVQHALILGNEGLPDQVTIDDANVAAAVDRVCFQNPKLWMKEHKTNRCVAIYVHGGLNDLAAGLNRTKVMGPWFKDNGIYPIFAVWQSGYWDSIVNIISDVIGSLISGVRDRKTLSLLEAVSDARDRLIEVAAIPGARPVWTQMKHNAIGASTSADGGMVQLARHLAKLKEEFDDLEVHLVGHSAGSIALGAFLGQLAANGLKAKTLSLYAPACSVDFALKHYVPAALNKVIDPKKVVFDILSEENERADTVGPTDKIGIYGKSLLYLVSRALEPTHKTPILGMEAVWNPKFNKDDVFAESRTGGLNEDVVAWRKQWIDVWGEPQVLSEKQVLEATPNKTIKSTHGCFDNWIGCIEQTLQRILGLSSVGKLPVRITSLEGL